MSAVIQSRLGRLFIALALAIAGGMAFADASESFVYRHLTPTVLEYDPGVIRVNRYLGRPTNGEGEADPSLAASQPNLDRFYRVVADRIKAAVGDERTTFDAWIFGNYFYRPDSGWPFVSRKTSLVVNVSETSRFDGRAPRNHRFRAGEDGLPPELPGGWWANAAVGAAVIGPMAFGILTFVMTWLSASRNPVEGFPVIVPDQNT